MNMISKAVFLAAGLALGARAEMSGLAGLGYDQGRGNELGQVTARIGLGMNAVDIGVGMQLDPSNDNDDAKFQLAVSGYFLGHLHDWGPVDTYFSAGGVFAKTAEAEDNIHVTAFVGLQPEITLLDHIVVSTRFGINVPLAPSFQLATTGMAVSIVEGANFKIVF